MEVAFPIPGTNDPNWYPSDYRGDPENVIYCWDRHKPR